MIDKAGLLESAQSLRRSASDIRHRAEPGWLSQAMDLEKTAMELEERAAEAPDYAPAPSDPISVPTPSPASVISSDDITPGIVEVVAELAPDESNDITEAEAISLMVMLDRIMPHVSKAFIVSTLRNMIHADRAAYLTLIREVERM